MVSCKVEHFPKKKTKQTARFGGPSRFASGPASVSAFFLSSSHITESVYQAFFFFFLFLFLLG